MKILVTGITGFIGRRFAEAIKNDKNEYICLVRENSKTEFLLGYSNAKIVRTDFSKAELDCAVREAELIIHMIGQMGADGVTEAQFEETNCNLTDRLVRAALGTNVKQFIYISTPGVQGFGKRLCLETEEYAPRNIYEKTKVRAEQIIISQLSGSDISYTIIRPDFVYGPGDYRRIKMYKNIRDKKFVLTTSGKSYLHPTYVDDVVQGIMCAMDNDKAYNEIFNISAPTDISVKNYLQVICGYFNVPLIHINIGYKMSSCLATLIDKIWFSLFGKEGFVSKNKIDFLSIDHSTSNRKAQELIGYTPEYDFKSGFELTMQWCKANNLL